MFSIWGCSQSCSSRIGRRSERQFILCNTTRQSRRGRRNTWPVHCNPCFEVATPVTLPTDSGRITRNPVSLFVCGVFLDSGGSVPRSPALQFSESLVQN